MIYKIGFTSKALRIIKKLPPHLQSLLKKELEKLAVNPWLGEKLSGINHTYRMRLGKYRVIYEIKDKELIILIINFGHRKEIWVCKINCVN